MIKRKTLPFFFLAALFLPGASLLAQQADGARILIELDKLAPLKASLRGIRAPRAQEADWDQVVDRLGELLSRAAGTKAEPQVLFYMGHALYNTFRPDEALQTFLDIKKHFPRHPLMTVPLDDKGATLVQQAINDCEKEIAFRKAHKLKLLPRPVLDSSLTAVLHFSMGDVAIQFYKNVAEKHRANFIKLAKQGFYDRLCLHRVDPGQDIKFGCPNTRNRPMPEWGQGGPGYVLPNEFSRLRHIPGVLTAPPAPKAGSSHGSQFSILLQPQPSLDFVQTPFAKVVKGLDMVRKMSVVSRNQYRAPLEKIYLNGISFEKGKPTH